MSKLVGELWTLIGGGRRGSRGVASGDGGGVPLRVAVRLMNFGVNDAGPPIFPFESTA
jgi:hypothetical protein